MSNLNTADYYRRREAQERALAAKAVSVAIASIHREMADSYRILADEVASAEPRPALTLAFAR